MGIAGRRMRYGWGASYSSKDDEVFTKRATVTGTRRAVQSKPRLQVLATESHWFAGERS